MLPFSSAISHLVLRTVEDEHLRVRILLHLPPQGLQKKLITQLVSGRLRGQDSLVEWGHLQGRCPEEKINRKKRNESSFNKPTFFLHRDPQLVLVTNILQLFVLNLLKGGLSIFLSSVIQLLPLDQQKHPRSPHPDL